MKCLVVVEGGPSIFGASQTNNDAKTIKSLPNHLLQIQLMGDKQGGCDIQSHLHLESLSAMRDRHHFGRATILYGAVTRPNGGDIAADTRATELKTFEAT